MLESTPSLAVVEPAPVADFGRFFADEYPRLARACVLLTGSVAEGEDLAQEAMARAFERWSRVAAMASPPGYVYRTAFNLNRRRIRRLGLAAKRLFSGTDPRDPAAVAADRDLVLRALASVSDTQREALILVGWLGMDATAAAGVLGVDAASVRGRVHRARSSLRELFGDDDA
jgi:RNA polymerase sigma factor (sigma-70 family)